MFILYFIERFLIQSSLLLMFKYRWNCIATPWQPALHISTPLTCQTLPLVSVFVWFSLCEWIWWIPTWICLPRMPGVCSRLPPDPVHTLHLISCAAWHFHERRVAGVSTRVNLSSDLLKHEITLIHTESFASQMFDIKRCQAQTSASASLSASDCASSKHNTYASQISIEPRFWENKTSQIVCVIFPGSVWEWWSFLLNTAN